MERNRENWNGQSWRLYKGCRDSSLWFERMHVLSVGKLSNFKSISSDFGFK